MKIYFKPFQPYQPFQPPPQMPNPYFLFKQFTIQQENCTMKVSTDACIFGAYMARELKDMNGNLLDIGTGTGLLSLMLAQDTGVEIDAVELDDASYLQAKENSEASPWSHRVHIFNADIVTFPAGRKYDHIISNPPFYEDDLLSGDAAKNSAKHDTSLTLLQLLKAIHDLLKENGSFSVLLPYHRISYFEQKAKTFGFHIHKRTGVRHSTAHPYTRGILIFSKTEKSLKEEELIIRDDNGNYSAAIRDLLGKYYLNV